MMSNYQKIDNFDIQCVKELIFANIRNSLIFIKKSPWTPMSQLSLVCTAASLEVPQFKWIKTYPLDFQTFLGPSDNVLFPVFSDISIELIRLPTYCTQNSKNVISTRACTQLLTSFPSQNHIDLVLHHPSQDALYYLIQL